MDIKPYFDNSVFMDWFVNVKIRILRAFRYLLNSETRRYIFSVLLGSIIQIIKEKYEMCCSIAKRYIHRSQNF